LVQDKSLQQALGLELQLLPAGMQATHLLPLQTPLQHSVPELQETVGEQTVLPSHVQELHIPLRHIWPEQQSMSSVQPEEPGL
jgi:hypothetical protein